MPSVADCEHGKAELLRELASNDIHNRLSMTIVADCEHGKAELLPELASNDIHSRLSDDILQEILCRLPSSKSVVQCKCVCTRWAALVSSPFFIGLFIAEKKRKQLPLFSCLFYTSYFLPSSRLIWRCLTMNLRGTLLNPENVSVSVSVLSLLVHKNETGLDVCASCNDLMLISEISMASLDYYICNVQTNQRLLLHGVPCSVHETILYAVTCDPYHHSSYGNEIIPDAKRRYSIAFFPYINIFETVATIHLFSNANKNCTGEWRKIVLSLPKLLSRGIGSTNGFVFDGKIHFDFASFIIGFDPYDEHRNNDGFSKSHLVHCPCKATVCTRHFQEFNGQLHMFVNSIFTGMQMWCLKDYKTSEWSLLHDIQRQDWIIPNKHLSSCVQNIRLVANPNYVYSENINFVGPHPSNPNIVYAILGDWIVLCDLSARTLEIASHIKPKEKLDHFFKAFSSILPIWPTPLPALP